MPNTMRLIFISILTVSFFDCGKTSQQTETVTNPPLLREEESVEQKQFLDAQDYFQKSVVPYFSGNCVSSGCHANPIEVDLTTFPFDYEGSYLAEDLVVVLGPEATDIEAQAFVIKKLIESMQTQYMPPAFSDAPVATEADIKRLQDWLKVSYFN